MSRLESIRGCPEGWLLLFDWFEAHPDEVKVVECDDVRRAHTFRFEFYRVRVAMGKEPELRKLYTNTAQREVTLDGNKVVFRLKEKTPIAELLRRSLTPPTEEGGQDDV